VRGACGIFIDYGKIFISFGALRRGGLEFFEEVEIPSFDKNNEFFNCLNKNVQALGEEISSFEKENSVFIDQIFCGLPWDINQTKVFNDTVLFPKRKKVTFRDANFIKKSVADKFLDWDDLCIHNIILNCNIEGKDYRNLSLGTYAKKIELKAQLFWLKDKLHRATEDIFDNIGKDFAGFIAPSLCLLSSAFNNEKKPQAVVYLGYKKSYIALRANNGFIESSEVDFGLVQVIEKLAERFIFSFPLAQEVFCRYISFKEVPYAKEVTVRKDSGYISLSTQTLSLFIKAYLKEKIEIILEEIRSLIGDEELIISFIGELNKKEGFYGFLNSWVPYKLKVSHESSIVSPSLGCLRYGVSRFLEKSNSGNHSFRQMIEKVYKEYF